MNIVIALVVGLIIGWLAEWLIDWFFWRPQRQVLSKRLAEAELEITALRVELAQLRQRRERAAVIEAVGDAPRPASPADSQAQDKVAAAEAALNTLWMRYQEQLQKLTDAEKEMGRLKIQLAQDQQRRAQLASAQSQLAQFRKQLAAAPREKPGADSELAQLRAEAQQDRGALEAAEAEIVRLQRQVVNLEDELGRPVKTPDDLTKITGIGPVFAKRLSDAGVQSFADLARLSPARLRKIADVKKWQKIDPETWIAEAVEFAGAQPR